MAERKRNKKSYANMTKSEREHLADRLKNGCSKNSIFQEGEYTLNAIQSIIETYKIDYKNKPPRIGAKAKGVLKIKEEDIPRLCVSQMSATHKAICKLWKPTGVTA